MCVHCLAVQHTRAALEGAACEDCQSLSFRVLHSRLAIFNEDGQACEPCGAEAARKRSSWGSQMDLTEDLETVEAHSRDSSASSDVLRGFFRMSGGPVARAVCL